MKEALASLSQRLRMIVTRGIVTQAAINSVRTMLQVTGLSGEALANIPLLLPTGRSALPKGGDVILVQVGGTRSHLLAICADDSTLRITDLLAGEFGDRDYSGQQIVFRQDRLEITTPLKLVASVTGDLDATVGGNVSLNVTGSVTASAASWNLTGDLKVTGNISATESVSDGTRSMSADREIYDGHTHPEGSPNTGTPNQQQ